MKHAVFAGHVEYPTQRVVKSRAIANGGDILTVLPWSWSTTCSEDSNQCLVDRRRFAPRHKTPAETVAAPNEVFYTAQCQLSHAWRSARR